MSESGSLGLLKGGVSVETFLNYYFIVYFLEKRGSNFHSTEYFEKVCEVKLILYSELCITFEL